MQQNPFNRPTNQPDSYKTLIVFRKSECVYDITFYFVSRFLSAVTTARSTKCSRRHARASRT